MRQFLDSTRTASTSSTGRVPTRRPLQKNGFQPIQPLAKGGVFPFEGGSTGFTLIAKLAEGFDGHGLEAAEGNAQVVAMHSSTHCGKVFWICWAMTPV